MKPFKRHNKRLLIMIAMSITCACASTAYAEINERPGPDATYDDKVVLDSEWQIYNNEYAGAEKRNVGLSNICYTVLDEIMECIFGRFPSKWQHWEAIIISIIISLSCFLKSSKEKKQCVA